MAGTTRDLNILGRKIKKAEKKVKRWKASTAQKREELTQWTTIAETLYQEIVQFRDAVLPQILAAESLNAQLIELISALLAKNDGD